MVELYKTLISSGNTSVNKFYFTGQNILKDSVAKEIYQLFQKFDSTQIVGNTSDSKKDDKPKPPRKVASLSIGFYQADFNAEGIDAILNCCKCSDFVHELILHGTYHPMEMQNVETLRDLLLTSPSPDNRCELNSLSIGGFAFTNQVASELLLVLNKQQRITHLTLHKWQLKAADLRTLFINKDCLDSSECSIEVLDVSGCSVGDDACKALAEVFRSNSKLKKLVLNNNSISDKGVKTLIQGLKESTRTKINVIELKDNDVSIESDSVKELMALLERDAGERQSVNREDSIRLAAVSNESFTKKANEAMLSTSVQDQEKNLEFL